MRIKRGYSNRMMHCYSPEDRKRIIIVTGSRRNWKMKIFQGILNHEG
jgi:hypothetical protein